MIPEQFRLKNTIKYPTSLIVGGLSRLGLEIADSLIDQGGYVIIADSYNEENLSKLNIFTEETLVSFIDFAELSNLDEDLKRLDYIFYFNHESRDLSSQISTQEFLRSSSHLDTSLSLANKFEAKFLLTTSIRANQLAQVYGDFSNSALAAEHRPAYTEIEIQKYSEEMTLEYIEKSHTDARIVRLGEVIGEGIDFKSKTFFNELILDVAKNQPLKLSKDGLESEIMVHLMDAAYGLIKAQFSRDTKGEVFSVSYPNQFTHLSLAYKIQDLDPEAKEIQFVEKDNNLPDIKLHKPAKNLSEIGWAPKVPIDKAIMQSIAAAKIYLLESQSGKYSEEDNVVNKLKGFLSLADKNDPSAANIYGGPISRLVAERQKQEDEKSEPQNSKGSKKSKKFRRKTVKEDATDKIWEASREAGNSINEIKRKPFLEILKYTVLIGFGIFIFIYIFAPIISIGKDVVALLPFYNNSLSAIENSSYSSNALHADILSNSLKDMDNNLRGFSATMASIGKGENYQQVIAVVNSYALLADGLKDIEYAADPFYKYLSDFESNIQQSNGVDSYLESKNSTKDYKAILEEFEDRAPYLDSGIEKYKKGLQQAENVNYSLIPDFISGKLKNLNEKLKERVEIVDSLKSMKNLPELLALNGPKTYLILLTDNTRLKPVGGEIASILEITLSEGKIFNITLKTPEQTSFDFSKITKSTLDEINLTKLSAVSKDSVGLQDFGNISDFNKYSQALINLYKDSSDQKIDGVFSLNYNSLADLLSMLNENGAGVRIAQTDFDGKDFLNTFANFQTEDESLVSKHALSAQVYSKTIENLLSNVRYLSPKIIQAFNKGIDNKDILASAQSLDYVTYIQDHNLAGNKFAIFGYNLGFNLTDPKIASIDKVPEFDLDEEVRIDSKDLLIYKLNIEVPTLGATQEFSICIPSNSTEAIIKNSNGAVVFVTNQSQTQKCLVTQIKRDKDLEVSWKTKANLTTVEGGFELNLPSKEFKGSNISLTKKIILEPDLKLIKINPSETLRNSTLVFNQDLNSDTNFVITYSKQ